MGFEVDDIEDGEKASASEPKKEAKEKKSNIDTTSDEEE
jgi:hypothetical protein